MRKERLVCTCMIFHFATYCENCSLDLPHRRRRCLSPGRRLIARFHFLQNVRCSILMIIIGDPDTHTHTHT